MEECRRRDRELPVALANSSDRAPGVDASAWLNLQLTWDLHRAMHSPAAREIERIKRIR